jgi:RND family efflux transporter MFP subunit
MTRALLRVAPLPVILALAGCGEGLVAEQTPSVRPILSVIVDAPDSQDFSFAGTIASRNQTNFAFRVLGRLVTRDVSVGETVKRGDRLAALDPLPLQLALRSTEAELANAEAGLVKAAAAEKRQGKLLERGDIAPSVFEQTQLARETAAATLAQAKAARSKAEEQLGYAELRAEFDGVVISVHSEIGQTVAAGEPVITVAGLADREVVIDVPDSFAERLGEGAVFKVASQLDASMTALGKVREKAPQADAATRTRRIKVALDNPPASFRFGATVTASLVTPIAARIELPVTALLERDGKTIVWIVDPATSSVSPHEVKVAQRDERMATLSEGLAPGTRVAIAGVNSLEAGQHVTIPRT